MNKLIILMIGLLFVSIQVFADPPGLAGKGGAEFPRGLEQHEKIPNGWHEGKKEGWEHHYNHHHHHHHHNNNELFDNNDKD